MKKTNVYFLCAADIDRLKGEKSAGAMGGCQLRN